MQALEVQWDKQTLDVEALMLNEEQVSCPVVHRFGPGIYIREVSFLAGTYAIGHHQNFEHVNILLKGSVAMLSDEGLPRELVAPFFYIGKPGRKVGYIREDMVWQNVYATEETDIEKLEAYYLTKSPVFLEKVKGFPQLECIASQDDYRKVISDFGYTEQEVRLQTENVLDAIELPKGSYKFQLGDSPLEGKGLFATTEMLVGEVIAPALIQGKRTIAGRFTNHAKVPNATMVRHANGDISLQAIKTIKGNQGGFLGDEITVDYREVLSLAEKKS